MRNFSFSWAAPVLDNGMNVLGIDPYFQQGIRRISVRLEQLSADFSTHNLPTFTASLPRRHPSLVYELERLGTNADLTPEWIIQRA